MAMSLRTYLNNQIKEKGSSLTKEKAKAGKYKSIAAAKKLEHFTTLIKMVR